MKSTSFSSDRLKQVILFFLMAGFLTACTSGDLWAQSGFGNQSSQQSAATANAELTKIGDISTFWTLIKLGGGVSVAISLVLAMGIFLIVVEIYGLFMDRMNSRILLSTNYRQLAFGDVNKLVRNHSSSMIGRLYAVMLSIFNATGNTTDFHDEIANYLQLQQDRHNTFRTRLAFLSDTAGALGLLGTVWGMFVTFFGGNLDSQRILNGMGLALVTTLVGLVVSIILNFFATEIFSVFNKRLALISGKADEFRLWLMAIVQKRNRRVTDKVPTNGNGSSNSDERTPAPGKNRPKMPQLSLKAISEFSQDGAIGQPLQNPITVFVETDKGQRVTGVPIRFDVVEGGGQLQNQKTTALIKTNNQGLAHLNWTLGAEVSPQKLKVSILNQEENALEFDAFARPFIPNLNQPQPGLENNSEQFSNSGYLA